MRAFPLNRKLLCRSLVSHLDIGDSCHLSRGNDLREEWLPSVESAGNLPMNPLSASPALLLVEGIDGPALKGGRLAFDLSDFVGWVREKPE